MEAAANAAMQRKVPDEDLVRLSEEFDQLCRELMVEEIPEETVHSHRQMRQVRPSDLSASLGVHEACSCQVSSRTIFNECVHRGMEADDLFAEFGSEALEMLTCH